MTTTFKILAAVVGLPLLAVAFMTHGRFLANVDYDAGAHLQCTAGPRIYDVTVKRLERRKNGPIDASVYRIVIDRQDRTNWSPDRVTHHVIESCNWFTKQAMASRGCQDYKSELAPNGQVQSGAVALPTDGTRRLYLKSFNVTPDHILVKFDIATTIDNPRLWTEDWVIDTSDNAFMHTYSNRRQCDSFEVSDLDNVTCSNTGTGARNSSSQPTETSKSSMVTEYTGTCILLY